MKAAAKLGAYGLVLGVALAGSAAIGSVGTASAEGHHQGHTTTTRSADSRGGTPSEEKIPGGVLVSQAGYTIQTDDRLVPNRAEDESFQFQVIGPDGAVVRDFEVRHERELHLIVAARDLGSFAHLHPSRASDGTWTVGLPPLAPGSYRAVFDFVPAGGPELKLGVDLAVPGWFDPRPLPPPATTSTVDGYEVSLSGAPAASSSSEVASPLPETGSRSKTSSRILAPSATSSLCGPATSPTCTSTRLTAPTGQPDRPSALPSKSPRAASTGCSSTSPTAERSALRRSPCTSRPTAARPGNRPADTAPAPTPQPRRRFQRSGRCRPASPR